MPQKQMTLPKGATVQDGFGERFEVVELLEIGLDEFQLFLHAPDALAHIVEALAQSETIYTEDITVPVSVSALAVDWGLSCGILIFAVK